MKKVKNYNVSILNKQTGLREIVTIDGWLLEQKDIEKWGYYFDHDKYTGYKFILHHSFRYDAPVLDDWWTVSEYTTSARMLNSTKKRGSAIFELGLTLSRHADELAEAQAKKIAEWGVINQ